MKTATITPKFPNIVKKINATHAVTIRTWKTEAFINATNNAFIKTTIQMISPEDEPIKLILFILVEFQ